MNAGDKHLIDAALARLPQWSPPQGFATRVAAQAAAQAPGNLVAPRRSWVPLVLQGLGVAACVSVGAWLAAVVVSEMLSAAAPDSSGLAWTLGVGSLLAAWHLVRRQHLLRA